MISRRNGLIAAVILLLLAVSFTAYLQTDIADLERQALADIDKMTGGRIRAERTSFSLLHGATLRLQGITLENATESWSFSADELQVNMELWPLLLGDARPNTIYLIAPKLDLSAVTPLPAIPALVQAMPGIPVEHLIVRQGAVTIAKAPYIDQIELDIRKAGHDANLLAEVHAAIGEGEIRMNGHAERDGNGPGRVFGKLEMSHAPIARLLGRPSPLPAYRQLQTALTFDISEENAWQLFGDITLLPDSNALPAMTLRGKLEGLGHHTLGWKEGFIRIGDASTITTDGLCAEADGCTIHAKTDHLPLHILGLAAGATTPAGGDAKASATLNWHDGVLKADAKSTLKKLRWADIDFPELQIEWSDIRHEAGQTSIATADITQPKKQGHIKVTEIASGPSDWRFSATAEDLDGWWVNMANGVLALHDMEAAFHGSGKVSARLHAAHRQDSETMAFAINADQAALGYGKRFTKPMGISASISGNMETGPEGQLLTVSAAQLADSDLHQLRWQRRGERQSLGIREAVLDFSMLHNRGIHLPGELDGWRGSLKGNFGNHTFRARDSHAAWLADLDATLQLQQFGKQESRWSGALRIKNGVLHSSRMTWHGDGKERATASGTLNLAHRHGTLNLRDVDFSWAQGRTLPQWLAGASIKGRIRADRFTWAGNSWDEVRTAYRLHDDRLQLRGLKATLADGSMSSDRLTLTLKPDAVHLSGSVRMGLVQLQKINGLDAILGAPARGYLYMNAFLDGELPFKGLAAWRGNGDIEIQRGGWHGGNFTLSLPNRDHGKREAYHFSRASSRFHITDTGIELSDLQIEAGDAIADGTAHIAGDGALSGKLRIRDGQGILNGEVQGVWPHIEVATP